MSKLFHVSHQLMKSTIDDNRCHNINSDVHYQHNNILLINVGMWTRMEVRANGKVNSLVYWG